MKCENRYCFDLLRSACEQLLQDVRFAVWFFEHSPGSYAFYAIAHYCLVKLSTIVAFKRMHINTAGMYKICFRYFIAISILLAFTVITYITHWSIGNRNLSMSQDSTKNSQQWIQKWTRAKEKTDIFGWFSYQKFTMSLRCDCDRSNSFLNRGLSILIRSMNVDYTSSLSVWWKIIDSVTLIDSIPDRRKIFNSLLLKSLFLLLKFWFYYLRATFSMIILTTNKSVLTFWRMRSLFDWIRINSNRFSAVSWINQHS